MIIEKVADWVEHFIEGYEIVIDYLDEGLAHSQDNKICVIQHEGGTAPYATIRTMRFRLVLLGTKNNGAGRKSLLNDITAIRDATLVFDNQFSRPECTLSIVSTNEIIGGRTTDGRYYYTLTFEVTYGG